jgi:hypothetical protein
MTTAVRRGLAVGIGMATLYSIWAMLIFVLTGSDAFAKYGTSLSTVVLTYYAAGAVAGIIAGALAPLNSYWFGTTLIGVLVALFIFFAIYSASEGPFWQWHAQDWKNVGYLGVIFGVVGSIGIRLTNRTRH